MKVQLNSTQTEYQNQVPQPNQHAIHQTFFDWTGTRCTKHIDAPSVRQPHAVTCRETQYFEALVHESVFIRRHTLCGIFPSNSFGGTPQPDRRTSHCQFSSCKLQVKPKHLSSMHGLLPFQQFQVVVDDFRSDQTESNGALDNVLEHAEQLNDLASSRSKEGTAVGDFETLVSKIVAGTVTISSSQAIDADCKATGTSPSGSPDKPLCFKFKQGTCDKEKICDFWHRSLDSSQRHRPDERHVHGG